VLVNNAGIMMLAKIADSDDALFDRRSRSTSKQLQRDARGGQAPARWRTDRQFSTSVVGTKLETYSVYAATKSAVETMTAILSKGLRGRKHHGQCHRPGPVATDLFLTGK